MRGYVHYGTRHLAAFALCILFGALANAGEAENPPEQKSDTDNSILQLDEMRVTARSTTDLQQQVGSEVNPRSVLESTTSISVITAEDLREQGIKTVHEALVTIPGVADDSRTESYISMRGGRSSSSAGALVLVDGQAQNKGKAGYVEYDAIPVEDIERIEVIRNPASGRWGAYAGRGVINIITKKGKKEGRPRVSLRSSYGSWETSDTSASVSGRSGKIDYAAAASWLDTEGYRHNEKRQAAGRLNLGWNPGESTRIGLNLSASEIKREVPRGLDDKWALKHQRRDDDPFTTEGATYRAGHSEHEIDDYSIGLTLAHQSDAFFMDASITHDHRDKAYNYRAKMYEPGTTTRGGITYNNFEDGEYIENRDYGSTRFDLSFGKHFDFDRVKWTPTLGVAHRIEDFEQDRRYPTADQYKLTTSYRTNLRKNDVTYDTDYTHAYLDNEFEFGEHFVLGCGVNGQWADYDVRTGYSKDVIGAGGWDDFATDVEEFGWFVSPGVKIGEKGMLSFTASQSYFFPTGNYYFWAMKYGVDRDNPPESLKPEDIMTYEINYKHAFSRKANLALTLFHMRIEDKYDSFYDSNNDFAGYGNIGDAVHQGIELGLDGMLTDWFGYRMSGSLIKAEWDGETMVRSYKWAANPANDTRYLADIDGKELRNVPEYTGLIGVDFYPIEGLKLSFDTRFVGDEYIDHENRIDHNGHVKCDARIAYGREYGEDGGKWEMYLLGKNIFDKETEAILNSSGERYATGEYQNSYYPQDGRYVEFGLSITF